MASLVTKFKPKRRWVQVSLRTMLVLVTLLCIALSLWVASAERQRRAIAAIEALDGSEISYVDRPVTFLRRWLPPVYFAEVNVVVLDNTQVTDAGVAKLRKALPNCGIRGP